MPENRRRIRSGSVDRAGDLTETRLFVTYCRFTTAFHLRNVPSFLVRPLLQDAPARQRCSFSGGTTTSNIDGSTDVPKLPALSTLGAREIRRTLLAPQQICHEGSQTSRQLEQFVLSRPHSPYGLAVLVLVLSPPPSPYVPAVLVFEERQHLLCGRLLTLSTRRYIRRQPRFYRVPVVTLVGAVEIKSWRQEQHTWEGGGG